MIDAYLYSYAGVLGATLWWYVLTSRDKATTYAKGLFLLSVLSYLILLPLSDGSWIGKMMWFARDIGDDADELLGREDGLELAPPLQQLHPLQTDPASGVYQGGQEELSPR